jgi:hypothetical protein
MPCGNGSPLPRPVVADSVEKVFLPDGRTFFRTADAFRARRRERPHRFTQKRPRTFVAALWTNQQSVCWGRAETTSLVSRRRWERPSGSPRSFREPSQIEVFEGAGAWRRLLLKAHGRVLETKTARMFPTRQEFFAVAKLTRWVIYGTPSDEFKKANADFHPIYMTPFDGFVR